MTAGLILGHCSAWAGQTTLAIAANFTGTMAKLIPVFEQQTGHHVRASYGSTGKLYAQIRQGAPFDAFMAADHKRPHLLVQDGLAVPGTQLPYAEGRLALWSRTEGLFSDGMSYLQSDPSRLAIGNPKTAPYGIAAMEFLDNLHLTEILKPKLVSGDSIAQTFQFVATGNAEAGFVALSQVWAWQGSAGSLWLIPRQLHQPISQHVILLNRGSSNPATLAWMEFLQSTKAQAIIREDGYDIPH
ncbi:molybdate ABC transporter substrate-binding protein [Marinobacter sp.]|uniref:molybdate ABC transporter substrate-binding protein n=1 Tax=Marinobacter sp. TaxID=50741 RepID=UPI0035636D1F